MIEHIIDRKFTALRVEWSKGRFHITYEIMDEFLVPGMHPQIEIRQNPDGPNVPEIHVAKFDDVYSLMTFVLIHP